MRIQFDEDKLRNSLKDVPGLKFQDVKYPTICSLRGRDIDKEGLPFLKRYPFRHEQEVRLLWEPKNENKSSLAISIPLSAISKITLSPWLHPSLVSEVKSLIRRIGDCSEMKIYQSTLISNADWLECGEPAT